MKEIRFSSQFKRDYKKVGRSPRYGKMTQHHLPKIFDMLQKDITLPQEYGDHQLIGNYANHRECHIAPDLLLIYRIEEQAIVFVRLGSHSELFL